MSKYTPVKEVRVIGHELALDQGDFGQAYYDDLEVGTILLCTRADGGPLYTRGKLYAVEQVGDDDVYLTDDGGGMHTWGKDAFEDTDWATSFVRYMP